MDRHESHARRARVRERRVERPDERPPLRVLAVDDVERHGSFRDGGHARAFRRRVQRHRHGEHAGRMVLVHACSQMRLLTNRLEGVRYPPFLSSCRPRWCRRRGAGACVVAAGVLRSRRRRAGHVQRSAAVLACCCSGCDEALRSDCDTGIGECNTLACEKRSAPENWGRRRTQGRQLAAVRH